MDIIEFSKVVFLAFFQGVAEFLPISSSGHLMLLGKLFGIDPESNFLLAIILHFGTLFSIVIFYFRDLLNILIERNFRLIGVLIIGSIPVVIVGFTLKLLNFDEQIFNNLLLVAIGFATTGTLLNFLKHKQKQEENYIPLEKLPFFRALLVGLLQAVAILPGISRSGSTIFGGLKNKLSPKDSAKFSFLLGLIAIGGATFVEILSKLKDGGIGQFESKQLIYVIVGFFVSAITGYISLSFLIKILQKGKLSYFSIYLYIVAILTFLIWLK